ncbi:MAG: hypothetical protein AAGD35_20240 [Actinomycetota bacterium]
MEFTIDCRSCPQARTEACDDCLVTFVSSRAADDAVVIDAAEFAAIRRLVAAGLVTDATAFSPHGGPDLRDVG